jgi:invasion protein IalB
MRKFTYKKNAGRAVIVVAVALLAFSALSKTVFAEKGEKTPPAPAAATAPAMAELGWTVRCPEHKDQDKKKEAQNRCEAFQRLEVAETHARVAEFAVGFPKSGEESARGAVILPLGILLEQGVLMRIDEGKAAAFKIQYCTNGGCVSFINLDKNTLEDMKKSESVHFVFKAVNGQNVDLSMKLAGFAKVLKQIL